MLKHGMLGLLSYGSMTGYEIMVAFRDSLSYFWSAQTSQIYRELKALEAAGLIAGEEVAQEGKPDKRVFSITDEGRAELARWLAEPIEPNRRSTVLMKVFFLGSTPDENGIAQLEALKARYAAFERGISASDAAIGQYRDIVPDTRASRYWEMTADFGQRYARMVQEWCDSCIERLREGEGA